MSSPLSPRGPRVLTIPPGVPFLATLADAILDGSLLGPGVPLDLADATIYLPTRRAARAFAEVLGERLRPQARLMPRIVPLGEVEEADVELAAMEGGTQPPTPAIPALERRLILTRLVQRWSRDVDRSLLTLGPDVAFMVPASPADAVGLAGDLEALMDGFETERVSWEALANAVDADYSRYFEITRRFVEIAAENWPKVLEERRASDPAWRRSALLTAEARRLERSPPPGLVVAAGSTGSFPATADLLAAIARLPRGAVVLPGLDLDLDEEAWAEVDPSDERGEARAAHGHPQAALHRLLRRLRCSRDAVRSLGRPTPAALARARLASEVLRPAETTDRWGSCPAATRSAIAEDGGRGIAIVEAADEREEALAVAIALRETLEDPTRTAALVTPDRGLAARVAIELQRWGVPVEDSAGLSLADTSPGRLARLAADAAADDFGPAKVVSLLAHPRVRLGLPRQMIVRAAAVLEVGVLRGPAPAFGIEGLRRALNGNRTPLDPYHLPRARKRLTAADWDLADDLLTRLERAFVAFSPNARGEGRLDLVALAGAHRAALEALSERAEEDDDPAGPDEAAVEALASLFDELELAADPDEGVEGRFGDYPLFFAGLMGERTVRAPARRGHRRVKVLGLLEARLLSADRIVLAGLDEGLWPPRAETDALLNRPMRARIGLSPPERRIGQTAHDFAQSLGAAEVVISRAAKREGKPTVPSRFLQRMKAFVGGEAWADLVGRGERYRRLAVALDRSAPEPPAKRPAPRPGTAFFPRSLSVTEIETLVRDPYAIFARHILKLDALDALSATPGLASRGTIIHAVLAEFATTYPDELPPDPLDKLIGMGRRAFEALEEVAPELAVTWWPRFETLAAAVVAWERERRAGATRVLAERSGKLPIVLADGSLFTLRARADRIERKRDGTFALVDFKTGSVPSNKVIGIGFSPQLTLEAAMLMRGSFKEVPATRETPELLYVKASGGRDPLCPQEVKPHEDRSVAEIVEEHLAGLTALASRYACGEASYLSRPYAQYARAYSDYDHLARVQEWSLAGDGEGDA